MESEYHSSASVSIVRVMIGRSSFFVDFLPNRNVKPDSIYLRGEDNEENCSLVIGDLVPASVAYDLRMRTRLPRRMYHHLRAKGNQHFSFLNSGLSIDKNSCIKCHSKRKRVKDLASCSCELFMTKSIFTLDSGFSL